MCNQLKPIVKWVGGKSSCIKILSEYLVYPKNHTYIEPFVGGGSVLFAFQPTKFIINDINPNLICMYNIIKTKCNKLTNLLDVYEKEYNSLSNLEQRQVYYNEKRDQYNLKKFNTNQFDAALLFEQNDANITLVSLFILINKLCFNGIYRENSNGKFNVPFGKYTSLTFDYTNIKNVSDYFNQSECKIYCSFYDTLLHDVLEEENKAIIYMDPPYYVCDQSKFNHYTNNIFTKQDHQQLYTNIQKWQLNRDVHIVCSNSYSDFIYKYSEKCNLSCRILDVTKSISHASSKEMISYTRNSNVWKQYQKYLSGRSNFKSTVIEKEFLSQFAHSVNIDSKRTKDCFNIGKLGEMSVSRLFSEYGIILQKCPFKESVRPDGYIEIGDKKYIVEIKSRTYTCTGTASEKIDCIPRKLYILYKKYRIPSIVIFVAGQIEEKSGKIFLKNDCEYITRFKEMAKEISGVEHWLSYSELSNWIKNQLPNNEIKNIIMESSQD